MEDLLQWCLNTDDSILLFINGMHTPYFDEAMELISSKIIWIPAYLALWWVVWKNYNWRVMLLCIFGLALTITLSDQIVSSLIRPFVERMRPTNPNNPISAYVHIVEGYRGGRFGFPSAHASNTFGLAFFCLQFFKRQCLGIAVFAWAVIVCYSRMYLGVHYFGDLVVGAVIGCLCAWLVCTAIKRCKKMPQPAAQQYVNLPIYVGTAIFALIFIWSGIAVACNLTELT